MKRHRGDGNTDATLLILAAVLLLWLSNCSLCRAQSVGVRTWTNTIGAMAFGVAAPGGSLLYVSPMQPAAALCLVAESLGAPVAAPSPWFAGDVVHVNGATLFELRVAAPLSSGAEWFARRTLPPDPALIGLGLVVQFVHVPALGAPRLSQSVALVLGA